MANSNLKDNNYPVPDSVLRLIQRAINKTPEGDIKGIKKAKGILASKEMTYPQMKMTMSFFDNCDLNADKKEYDLLGGDEMKNWVSKMLKNERNSIHQSKQIAMDTGKENSFRRTHTKDRDNANPTGVSIPDITKGSTNRKIMNNVAENLEQELKHMQYLNEYFNNNNKKI